MLYSSITIRKHTILYKNGRYSYLLFPKNRYLCSKMTKTEENEGKLLCGQEPLR